jgi:SnoaL-like domain
MITKLKHAVMRVSLSILPVICIASGMHAQTNENEKTIRAYYTSYETKDWNTMAAQFADGFTFTSPKNDHISLEQFKEECWPTNKFIKTVDLIKMTESSDKIILLVQIMTTDNKMVRNLDVFSFNNGKIKSIEVFFGLGQGYPGNPDNTK